MNVIHTTKRHNRNEGIESCNIPSWQVPTLTCPCCASAPDAFGGTGTWWAQPLQKWTPHLSRTYTHYGQMSKSATE
ncbi:MAG: hypothetical protein ACKJSG_02220, partial [Lentisphaeria bacterium]